MPTIAIAAVAILLIGIGAGLWIYLTGAGSSGMQALTPIEGASNADSLPSQSLATPSSSGNQKSGAVALSLKSDDPLKGPVDQFLEAARLGDAKGAIASLDQDRFRARVFSDKGSERAQYYNLEIPKLLGNFGSRSLEGMPRNGGVRHWDVVAKTKHDGLDAVLLRYYCEPLAPAMWFMKSERAEQLASWVSIDDYLTAAEILIDPQPSIPADLSAVPHGIADGNGLLLPRAGYLLLVFDIVEGKPRLVDLINPISKINFSRCAGELYMRDYRVIVGARFRTDNVKSPDPFYPTLFGEIPKNETAILPENDWIAYYSRYKDPQAKPYVVPPLSEDIRQDRFKRLERIVVMLDNNSPDIETELKRFRADFGNDPAGDMAFVSFAMMRDDPDFQAPVVSGILAAADRLISETKDPYLEYVRWYVAFRSGSGPETSGLAKSVEVNSFRTAMWFQTKIEAARENGDKDSILGQLKAYAQWWNPNPTQPTRARNELIRNEWRVALDRQQGRQGDIRQGNRPRGPGGGPPGIPGRESAMNGEGTRSPNSSATRQSLGPPPGFGEPPSRFGNNRGASGPDMSRNGTGRSGPGTPPAITGPTFTIRIANADQPDINEKIKKLAESLKVNNYQFSRQNQDATLILSFDGDIQKIVEAITFGSVQSHDPNLREIRVTIP